MQSKSCPPQGTTSSNFIQCLKLQLLLGAVNKKINKAHFIWKRGLIQADSHRDGAPSYQKSIQTKCYCNTKIPETYFFSFYYFVPKMFWSSYCEWLKNESGCSSGNIATTCPFSFPGNELLPATQAKVCLHASEHLSMLFLPTDLFFFLFIEFLLSPQDEGSH